MRVHFYSLWIQWLDKSQWFKVVFCLQFSILFNSIMLLELHIYTLKWILTSIYFLVDKRYYVNSEKYMYTWQNWSITNVICVNSFSLLFGNVKAISNSRFENNKVFAKWSSLKERTEYIIQKILHGIYYHTLPKIISIISNNKGIFCETFFCPTTILYTPSKK